MNVNKLMLREEAAGLLQEALVDFGFTKKKAAEIAGGDFFDHNVDLPFEFGRLVINKGSIERAARKRM